MIEATIKYKDQIFTIPLSIDDTVSDFYKKLGAIAPNFRVMIGADDFAQRAIEIKGDKSRKIIEIFKEKKIDLGLPISIYD